jgi:hypothetical protein
MVVCGICGEIQKSPLARHIKKEHPTETDFTSK